MDKEIFHKKMNGAQQQIAAIQKLCETLPPEQRAVLDENLAGLTQFFQEAHRSGYLDTLQHSEDLYRPLFENKHTVMLIIDPADGRIVDANPAALAFYGYERERLLQLNIAEINILSEDQIREEMERARQAQRAHFNFQHRLTNGQIRDVEVYSGPIVVDGKQLLYSVVHDNTERKKTEAALRASEEQYRNLFEDAIEGIVQTTPDGRYLHINQSYARMFGYASAEEMTQSITDLASQIYADPADRARLLHQLDVNDRVENFESQALRKDGQKIWVSMNVSAVRDPQGALIRLDGRVMDITLRKQAESSLQQKTAELDRFFSITLELLCIADTDGYFRRLNPAWETALGYPIRELEGSRFLDYVHPDDLDRTLVVMAELSEQKAVVNFVNRYRCKDGTYRWIDWQTAPSGNLIYAAARDITERKQTEDALRANEDRLRLATGVGNIGIWDWDIANQVLTWDDSMYALYGIRKENYESSFDAWLKTLHPEDYEYIQEEVQAGMRGEREFAAEFRIVRPDQTVRYIKAASQTFRSPDGSALRMVGTNIDITERKQAEDQLQLTNEKLIVMVYTLEQLNHAAHLVHEMDDLLQACNMPEEAYMAVQQFGPLLFPDTCGALYLISSQPEIVEAVTTWGEALQSEPVFSPNECWALRRGKVQYWSSLSLGLRCQHVHVFAGDYLSIPLLASGELLGLLHLESADHHLSEKNLGELAQTITEHLGLTLANIRLRDKLRAESIRDLLTGLFNRRFMEEFMARELSRAHRKQLQVGVLMLDIDHFKDFNDTYGHHGGDEVLRQLSLLLQANIRAGDIACRFGGEEFILILPEATCDSLCQRAEAIRTAVQSMQIEFQRKLFRPVSVSVGAAVFPDHGSNPSALLSAVDQALYRAKEKGRNRVEMAKCSPVE